MTHPNEKSPAFRAELSSSTIENLEERVNFHHPQCDCPACVELSTQLSEADMEAEVFIRRQKYLHEGAELLVDGIRKAFYDRSAR
jgi:hypothetical protein